MNETILSSFNDLANDGNKLSTSKTMFKDLIDRLDQYNKEFLERKEKNMDIVTKYEKEVHFFQIKQNLNKNLHFI